MQKTWDILGIGTASVDDLLTVERFPQPDEKLPIRAQQRQGGGQVATGLVAAARHGARTAYLTRIGEDEELSGYVIRELEREGVDCSMVERAPGCSPVHSFVIVDPTGRRTILHNNAGLSEPERIDPAWVAAARVLFIDQNAPHAGLRAARMARELGVPVVADLERPQTPGISQLIAHTDHLIVSAGFAAQITAAEAALTEGLEPAGGSESAGGSKPAGGALPTGETAPTGGPASAAGDPAADMPALVTALARLHRRLRAQLPPVQRTVEQPPVGTQAEAAASGAPEVPAPATAPVVVITCGECGCWYTETGYANSGDLSNGSPTGGDFRVIHVPAIPVQVVDTTGCGDVFHGAYAAAIARGEPLARAVLIANAAAGLKATKPGGRAGIPTLAVVERLLNSA